MFNKDFNSYLAKRKLNLSLKFKKGGTNNRLDVYREINGKLYLIYSIEKNSLQEGKISESVYKEISDKIF